MTFRTFKMSKTPVSLVEELAAKHKQAPPQFELIDNLVTSAFQYKVTYNGIVAYGTGGSKKEAKHKSAEELLFKLNETKPVVCVPDVVVTRNYVGDLGELCAGARLHAPRYVEFPARGPSHAPHFEISCEAMNFTETGATKKLAKQLAAQKVLQRMQNVSPETVKPAVSVATVELSKPEVLDQHLREQRVHMEAGHTELLGSLLNSLKLEEKENPALPANLAINEAVWSSSSKQSVFNYVGQLGELCASKQWHAPKYIDNPMQGPSHAPRFMLSMPKMSETEALDAEVKTSESDDEVKERLMALFRRRKYCSPKDTSEVSGNGMVTVDKLSMSLTMKYRHPPQILLNVMFREDDGTKEVGATGRCLVTIFIETSPVAVITFAEGVGAKEAKRKAADKVIQCLLDMILTPEQKRALND
ncbi:hypothetical protein B566_EDAN009419 [Ephemera danica]|nr:hypothetical protein B566_EDAN009419 [Ephemera danica]